MEWIDTHAHVYDEAFADAPQQVIARSIQAGIKQIYLPSIAVNTIEPMLALAAQYPKLLQAMIGLHPCYVKDDFEQQLDAMEAWITKHSFAAIGEVGIDLYRDQAYQVQQETAFVRQINWAKQYQLPLVIHCRNAFEETLQLLEKHQDGSLKGIFHCFSGSLVDAQRIIALGFYLGIGGIATFKNAGLAEIIAELPLKHLVLETDSPYLAPVPYRGKVNEPSYLPYIGAKLAELHGTSVEAVAAITTTNARKVFEKPV